jgi:WD40 repeat protein
MCKQVVVWDASALSLGVEIIYRLHRHTREVNGLDFNHDASLLCSGSLDHLVAIWDMSRCVGVLFAASWQTEARHAGSQLLPPGSRCCIGPCFSLGVALLVSLVVLLVPLLLPRTPAAS